MKSTVALVLQALWLPSCWFHGSKLGLRGLVGRMKEKKGEVLGTPAASEANKYKQAKSAGMLLRGWGKRTGGQWGLGRSKTTWDMDSKLQV